jgi:hypothetical protein
MLHLKIVLKLTFSKMDGNSLLNLNVLSVETKLLITIIMDNKVALLFHSLLIQMPQLDLN